MLRCAGEVTAWVEASFARALLRSDPTAPRGSVVVVERSPVRTIDELPPSLRIFAAPPMRATHRYLAIIAPPPPIASEVVRIREALRGLLGDLQGMRLMPHVTLFLADVPEEQGDLLVTGIEASLPRARSFELHYDGITHFPDQRTIYIDPVEKAAIGALRGTLLESVLSIGSVKDAVRATEHPHLTIAAGLGPEQFKAAWVVLKPHVFKAAHPVQSILWLRRSLRSGAAYEVLRTFPLEG